MLKERLMNPGSYFRFGWQRETERVDDDALSCRDGMEGMFCGMYHKGHVR